MPIGNIYSKSNFLNLTDFETNGGFSVSAGKIITPADATKYIRLPGATALDKYTISARFKWLTASASDNGLQVGIVSVNTTTVWSITANAVLKTADANFGKVHVHYTGDNSDHYSTGTVAAAVNDVFLLTVDYNKNVLTVTLVNETQNQTASFVFTSIGGFTDPYIKANTGKITIQAAAVGYELHFFQYASALQTGQPLAVGDSLTQGFYAGATANRWAEIVGAQISAGGGDKTAEVVQRTAEIITYVRPSIVYLMIGTNDAGQSVALSTIMANIEAFVLALEAAGIPVIKLAPPPGSAPTQPVRNALLELYPGTTVVGTFDALATGTSLQSGYDAGDALHLNADGNTALAAQVTAFTPSYNLRAGIPAVVVSKETGDFSTYGITDKNTHIVYLVDNPLLSYVPGRAINGITGFEADKGYYVVPKMNRDLSDILVPSA